MELRSRSILLFLIYFFVITAFDSAHCESSCPDLPGSTCVCRRNVEDDDQELYLDCVRINAEELITDLDKFTQYYLPIGKLRIRDSDLSELHSFPEPLWNMRKLVLYNSKVHLHSLGSIESHLRQLQILFLDSGNLTRISPKAFEGLSSLEELHIYNNRELKHVDEQAFDELQDSLKILVLKENGMTKIPKAVTTLINLKRLDLHGNLIRTVSNEMVNYLDDLKNLNSLEMNSLNCTCELGKGDFVAWVQRMAIKGSLCELPPRLQGRDVSTMLKEEFCDDAVRIAAPYCWFAVLIAIFVHMYSRE